MIFALRFFLGLAFLILFLGNADSVAAVSIHSSDKYAYGENVGWLNFGTTEGSVGVTRSGKLTGYAWGENIGWLSLNCSNTGSCGAVDYGVSRDSETGKLSGYAYGENIGWVNFSCSNTSSCGTVDYGVTVDDSGVFSGYAWGENIGWLSLNCSTTNSCGTVNYLVKTSEPFTTGVAIPQTIYNVPPTPPPEGFSVLINDGVFQTTTTLVTLQLQGGPDTAYVDLAEDRLFRTNFQRGKFSETLSYALTSAEGYKTVYARFYTEGLVKPSEVYSDDILYKVEPVLARPPSVEAEVPGRIPEGLPITPSGPPPHFEPTSPPPGFPLPPFEFPSPPLEEQPAPPVEITQPTFFQRVFKGAADSARGVFKEVSRKAREAFEGAKEVFRGVGNFAIREAKESADSVKRIFIPLISRFLDIFSFLSPGQPTVQDQAPPDSVPQDQAMQLKFPQIIDFMEKLLPD